MLLRKIFIKNQILLQRTEILQIHVAKKQSKTRYKKVQFQKVTYQPYILNINTKILELVI